MAGGVALNCTANGVIKRSRMFKEMFVQPAAGDDGSALGAALVALRQRDPGLRLEKMGLPLWGPAFDSEAVRVALDGRPEFAATSFDSFDDLANDVARRVAQGQIVGWFQGRMEFGPRALGNRSILADPRHPGMRDLMNQRVKNREDFRPFAPAVTLDAAHRFFEVDEGDESLYAYMLCVAPVRQAFREQLPAVTHVDGSARVQTVTQEDNPRFWAVLKAFEKVSGIPVLLNTSFNVRGQPIVCTPVEALDTFLLANLDALAIEDYVIVRSR
jgi:carbamoyltransferase